MKLVRYGNEGREKPGLIDADGQLRDLSSHVADVNGPALSKDSLKMLYDIDPASLPAVSGAPRLGACVGDIGKVELGVVIGPPCKYVSVEEALDYVAGYFVSNDVSERHFQSKLAGQWTKGKSCDTFGPIGPWLVTSDEILDPQNLDLGLDLNGQRMQTGNTSTMIFTVAECISHLSQMMTLLPGDVISTGTPPGVGMGIKPEPIYLKEGDVMDVWIEGLGQQTQTVGQDK